MQINKIIVIYIDAISIKIRDYLVVYGIEENGYRHVINVKKITHVYNDICDILKGLIKDGCKPILFVIKGDDEIKKAIREYIGNDTLIQICRDYPIRVIQSKQLKREMKAAFDLHSEIGIPALESIAEKIRSIDDPLSQHILNNKKEYFAVDCLNISDTLKKVLTTTNGLLSVYNECMDELVKIDDNILGYDERIREILNIKTEQCHKISGYKELQNIILSHNNTIITYAVKKRFWLISWVLDRHGLLSIIREHKISASIIILLIVWLGIFSQFANVATTWSWLLTLKSTNSQINNINTNLNEAERFLELNEYISAYNLCLSLKNLSFASEIQKRFDKLYHEANLIPRLEIVSNTSENILVLIDGISQKGPIYLLNPGKHDIEVNINKDKYRFPLILFKGDNKTINMYSPISKMAFVPFGCFASGENAKEFILLQSYYISKYEVSNSEYALFLGKMSNKYGKDSVEYKSLLPLNWDSTVNEMVRNKKVCDWPVRGVSWYAAVKYCNELGGFLPNMYQFEKAARGIDGQLWPWGNILDEGQINCVEAQLGTVVPVYENVNNLGADSPYGCKHMLGNVWEWTNEGYIMGGSYSNFIDCCCVYHYNNRVSKMCKLSNVGFRICQSPYYFVNNDEFKDLLKGYERTVQDIMSLGGPSNIRYTCHTDLLINVVRCCDDMIKYYNGQTIKDKYYYANLIRLRGYWSIFLNHYDDAIIDLTDAANIIGKECPMIYLHRSLCYYYMDKIPQAEQDEKLGKQYLGELRGQNR